MMELNLQHEHPWAVTPGEAIEIQEQLAPLVAETPLTMPIETVAGVDMSVRNERVQAAVVVLDMADFNLVDKAIWRGAVEFPYIPGLLSFREVPAVLRAFEKLSTTPDLIMTDSQGRAHMRRLGLACHLGLLLDMPTVGVAKSRLVGRPQGELKEVKGSHVPLVDDGEVIGEVVRTRSNVKPVYVSVGHRVVLSQAVELTMACTGRYKIPEPTRQAHLHSRKQPD